MAQGLLCGRGKVWEPGALVDGCGCLISVNFCCLIVLLAIPGGTRADLQTWKLVSGKTMSVLAEMDPAHVLPTSDNSIGPCQSWLRGCLERAD